MIKLACNYYPEVKQLVEEKKIVLDYFKYPGLGYQMKIFEKSDLSDYQQFITELNQVRPVMIHGLGLKPHNICSKTFIRDFDVNYAKKIIELSGINGISLHLAGVDTSLSGEENKRIIIENISYLKENFCNVEFISLENADGNPFMKEHDFGICVDPDFISEIIHKSKLYFLLDISHAYCSAKNLGIDFETYLYRLPLDEIYEVHINGWVETENDIMSHTKINELGYKTLQDILKKYKPRIVTLEYGRDNDRIHCGIPLISPHSICENAKEEIMSQIDGLWEIIKYCEC
ncbi:MAG: uncharacterized protein K0R54_5899 [Clostridiaceae bacterium]|jgi:uncharacterized protein (UPF0276 family)|nr:uncharacterized protein [Clostridiaceae bacterium]